MVWSNLSIKILGINFGNFTLDNSIWDKISENITKKIHLWNRVRLSLRGRKLFINQILLSKLWYVGQIYKYISMGRKENPSSYTSNPTPHLEGESNQCPMEGSHAISIELNFELQPWPSPFQTKSDSSTHCT